MYSDYRLNEVKRTRILANESFLHKFVPSGLPRWGLCYPSTYEVGSCSLGIHYLYYLLRNKGVTTERFFTDELDVSLESGKRPTDFEILTFTVSYELEVLSLINFLKRNKIPVFWEKRDESYPLIGAGGALTYINPIILLYICDFVVCGDAESGVLDYIVSVLRKYSDKSKKYILSKLSEHDSIIVPQDAVKTAQVGVRKSLRGKPCSSVWVTPKSAFGKTFLVELQRGCIRGCLYCPLSSAYKPVRIRDIDEVLFMIDEVRDKVKKIGLLTPEASDYPYISDLIDYIMTKNLEVSFASLRIDALNDKILEAISKGSIKFLTVAPEAGNDKLRFRIGKPFANELIFDRILNAVKSGIKKIKLYFMIGLPYETDSDINDLAVLVNEILKLVVNYEIKQVVVSVSPFVPKPFTRFEMEEFCDSAIIKHKIKLLNTGLRIINKKLRKILKINISSYKEAFVEALIAQADFSVARKVIEFLSENKRWSLLLKDKQLFTEWKIARQKKPWRKLLIQRGCVGIERKDRKGN